MIFKSKIFHTNQATNQIKKKTINQQIIQPTLMSLKRLVLAQNTLVDFCRLRYLPSKYNIAKIAIHILVSWLVGGLVD